MNVVYKLAYQRQVRKQIYENKVKLRFCKTLSLGRVSSFSRGTMFSEDKLK